MSMQVLKGESGAPADDRRVLLSDHDTVQGPWNVGRPWFLGSIFVIENELPFVGIGKESIEAVDVLYPAVAVDVETTQPVEADQDRDIALARGDTYSSEQVDAFGKVLAEHFFDVAVFENPEISEVRPPLRQEVSDRRLVRAIPVGKGDHALSFDARTISPPNVSHANRP